MESKELKFNRQTINFEIENKNVMVNATEMAKVFGKLPNDFLRLEQTEFFIKECCKDENYFELLGMNIESQKVIPPFENGKDSDFCKQNSGFGDDFQNGISRFENRKKSFLKVEKGGRNSGTWMHRVLALKFAAWLNPAFEVWVFKTIDSILFDEYRQLDANLKETAKRKARIKVLRNDLQANPPVDERVKELFSLEDEDKTESRKPYSIIGKKVKSMITLFTPKEMTGQ